MDNIKQINKIYSAAILLLFLLFNSAISGQDKLFYPETYQAGNTDTIWGKVVKDPYRWMEHIRSENVENWLIEETKFTKKYLGFTTRLEDFLYHYSADCM